MGSSREFVEFVAEQFDANLRITYRMMFGEYGIYSDGRMFALVCDDRLFYKPTEAGRAFIGDVTEGSPYPGAKPCFLIEDRIEDGDWLSELARVSLPELPPPRPRKRRKA